MEGNNRHGGNSRQQSSAMVFTCHDCGAVFVFSVAEQGFYRSKQLSIPKRCKACRAQRKARLVPDKGTV